MYDFQSNNERKKRRQKTSNVTACGKRGEDKEQRKDQMTRKHEIRL